ncbi:MAG: hypothetical protein IPJ18_10605 [Betaproteobacteria bacterium]|nr:hypothetical protein [Betaproteobacteria bacterium]
MQAVRNKEGADADHSGQGHDDNDDDILILDPEESDACGDLGNDQDDASTAFTPAQSDLIQKSAHFWRSPGKADSLGSIDREGRQPSDEPNTHKPPTDAVRQTQQKGKHPLPHAPRRLP